MIKSHRNYLACIHSNSPKISGDFRSLILEIERDIFVYVVSVKRLSSFIGKNWLQIPLIHIKTYLDSIYVKDDLNALFRIGYLSGYLSKLDLY